MRRIFLVLLIVVALPGLVFGANPDPGTGDPPGKDPFEEKPTPKEGPNITSTWDKRDVLFHVGVWVSYFFRYGVPPVVIYFPVGK